MRFTEFCDASKLEWNTYLTRIDSLNLIGRLDSQGGTILFPSILLCTETRTHFIAELIGARRGFRGLTLKVHKEPSIHRYFGQFSPEEPDAVVQLNSFGNQFIRVTLSQGVGIDTIATRFPFAKLFPSVLVRIGGRGSPLGFGREFRSAAIHNSMLINHHAAAVRVKHILSATIIAKTLSATEYSEWLRRQVLASNEAKGIHTCGSDEEDFAVAGQLANVYLFSGLRETTIGEFLRSHPGIIQNALRTRRFIYEPHLIWCNGPSVNDDHAINPDLMIERDDGAFDIYDLKTAVLKRGSITKGARRRRRFIDYVEEGVAQLAHYLEYFRYPKNAAHAWEKYRIRVANPNLVLVVGNWDNARPKEVEEASRRLNNISIVDYDTLLQLFLSARRPGMEAPSRL